MLKWWWILVCGLGLTGFARALVIVPDRDYEVHLRNQVRFGDVLAPYFGAQVELFRLKLKNGKQYEIYLIQPEHLANVYFQLSLFCENNLDDPTRVEICEQFSRDPKPLQGMLHLNRIFAYSQLHAAYQFLLKEWEAAGLFVKGYGEGRTKELNTMKDGLWPTLIVRRLPDDGQLRLEDDNPIVWVVSYALDYGEGLPWEWRIYHPEFPHQGVPRMKTPTIVPARHIFPATPYHDFSSDPFLSTLLSERSFLTGGRLEIKNYLKAKDFDENLAAVIHKLMTRFQFHRWSATPVLPTAGFRSLLDYEKAEFWAKHRTEIGETFRTDSGEFVPHEANLIIDTAFNHHAFPFAHISEIFVEANSYVLKSHQEKNARAMLFNRRYAIKEVVASVENDPDFGGTTSILRTTPSLFETETANALMRSGAGADLLEGAQLTRVGMRLKDSLLPLCPQMVVYGNIPERLLSLSPSALLIANPWQQWIYH